MDKVVDNEILKSYVYDTEWTELIDGVISDRRNKDNKVSKIKLRLVKLKENICVQVTEYIDTKVIHANKSIEEFRKYLYEKLLSDYKQASITTGSYIYNILISKKGQVTIKKKKNNQIEKKPVLMHNRVKQYLIKEGVPADFLVKLGVMNPEGYVIKAKYDKYRQINRFLEFVEDIVSKLPRDREVKIIDFGCGKSYLTFAIYYYLRKLKDIDVCITGIDLKEDVINHCNSLAKELAYDKLTFIHGDIADYECQDNVDMVVTLHACDTATDYAIMKAIKWNARVILSVPCCHHEINNQIQNDSLSPVLDYGILKERMSALITDGVRAKTLEEWGYETAILEFIDMEHTPKNLMIRGIKKRFDGYIEDKKLKTFIEDMNIKPTIKELLK